MDFERFLTFQLMSLVGETSDCCDDICGAVVNNRNKGDKIGKRRGVIFKLRNCKIWYLQPFGLATVTNQSWKSDTSSRSTWTCPTISHCSSKRTPTRWTRTRRPFELSIKSKSCPRAPHFIPLHSHLILNSYRFKACSKRNFTRNKFADTAEIK